MYIPVSWVAHCVGQRVWSSHTLFIHWDVVLMKLSRYPPLWRIEGYFETWIVCPLVIRTVLVTNMPRFAPFFKPRFFEVPLLISTNWRCLFLAVDAYSRVIARLFDEAAGQDNSLNMAVMSCYDWTDVCKRLGITTYPTVISFKDGSMRAFSGVMNVTSFVKLAKV